MKITKFLLLSLFAVYGSTAFALPALQLGPGSDPADAWSYIAGGDDTWKISETSFDLNAYANAEDGNGAYAWTDGTNLESQYAYLVVAAVPSLDDSGDDVFDITIGNDTATLSLFTSGYGAPPLEDSNSLAPHDIYDTYFEIYEFVFNGEAGPITDQQPVDQQDNPSDDEHDPGQGYTETFSIDINWLEEGLAGLHFDLFTVTGGQWVEGDPDSDSKLLRNFAPFSHDAEYRVPEPSILALMGFGLLGLGLARRRMKK